MIYFTYLQYSTYGLLGQRLFFCFVIETISFQNQWTGPHHPIGIRAWFQNDLVLEGGLCIWDILKIVNFFLKENDSKIAMKITSFTCIYAVAQIPIKKISSLPKYQRSKYWLVFYIVIIELCWEGICAKVFCWVMWTIWHGLWFIWSFWQKKSSLNKRKPYDLIVMWSGIIFQHNYRSWSDLIGDQFLCWRSDRKNRSLFF